MNALDLITGAVGDLGAINPGETISSEESADGLVALNQMLGTWSTQGVNLHTVASAVHTLTPAKQSYEIGPTGADFVTTRPMRITAANCVLYGTTVRTEMRLLDPVEWAALPERGVAGERQLFLYCDYTAPNVTVYVLPVPTKASGLELFKLVALSTFPDLTTEVVFPEGYERPIRSNLALALAPGYQVNPSQALVAMATSSLAALNDLNAKLLGSSAGRISTPVGGNGQ